MNFVVYLVEMVYYNENDKFAAAWLKNLITAGHIAKGDVDERSIEEVCPEDLRGYAQCHFFAGIGVWSYALRLAGWPDDRPVWTGSCPCQPFSAAGKREGFDDPRHLWPQWFRLIREHCPDTIFGEQVDKALGWLDLVSGDLEDTGYAFGTAIMGAHSVGAPHIRQRAYFVADSQSRRERSDWDEVQGADRGCGRPDELGYTIDSGLQRHGRSFQEHDPQGRETAERHGAATSGAKELGDSKCERNENYGCRPVGEAAARVQGSPTERERLWSDVGQPMHALSGFWGNADWLWCRDQKYRAVESGTFPLVNGTPNRVGRLRGYGNALCAPQAEAFIEAYMECRP